MIQRLAVLFTFIFLSQDLLANIKESQGYFSGYVSRINRKVGLVRFRVKFENQKFLNRLDKIEFWTEGYRKRACIGYIKGKTNQYLLVRIPDFNTCVRKINFTTGAYIKFFSDDFLDNLKIGNEVVNLLLKKRLALDSRLELTRKELDTFIEKKDAVNRRYRVLKEKLELEWNKELSDLEEDKNNSLQVFKHLQVLLDEVDHKLQQYKVNDSNLEIDRWSLDRKIYFRK